MAQQLALPIFNFSGAVKSFTANSAEERGAVFTRREVVEFILDLAGYSADKPLHTYRLLEPALGQGDFLIPVVERLLTVYHSYISEGSGVVSDLCNSIRAVEVHYQSIEETRAKLIALLQQHGVSDCDAKQLLDAWLIKGDFLLVDLSQTFTHAVGNPPYVRQELIPNVLMAEYRARYSTIYDRADLYIPFIERCLTCLSPGGTLGFICADRWMKNKYGGPLRAMVARQYHLACYVDMVDTPAFHSEVIAYPAITIIRKEKPGLTRVAHRPRIDRTVLAELAKAMQGGNLPKRSDVVEIAGIAKNSEPWILQSFDQLAVVRRLEADYPILEATGCKVGIGVATGADKVYIGPFESLDVESDRKLPLVKTKDIESGNVSWQGLGVINPFRDDGSLVDLIAYPKLARFLERHADAIRKRNCAKKNPKGWYRTIDRIYPDLTYRPKLLIPDIKGKAHIVYEEGHFYPHHNLYFITSDDWNLKALQAVLQSGIAKLFVSIYSTRMRGGYFRFQAQYLRRIRLPKWKDVPEVVQNALKEAADEGNVEACNRAAFDVYRLTREERTALGGNEIKDD